MVKSRPAATSRMVESAVCPDTSASCNRRCPVVVREPCLSARHIPPRTAGHAATRLTTTAAASEIAVVNATILQSTAIEPASGSRTGAHATSTLAPETASATPTAPAAEATTMASAMPRRMIRLSVAPRAAHSAISPRLRSALTRNRLPTLAQVISRTAMTAPMRIQIAFAVCPTYNSEKESSVIPGSASAACCGYVIPNPALSDATSVRASLVV